MPFRLSDADRDEKVDAEKELNRKLRYLKNGVLVDERCVILDQLL